MRAELDSSAPDGTTTSGDLLGLRKMTAARMLDCSRWTIDRLIQSGDLVVFQLRGEPRIRYDSLREFIEARTLRRSA